MKIEHAVEGVKRVSEVLSWHIQIVPIAPRGIVGPSGGVQGVGLSLFAVVSLCDAAAGVFRPAVVVIDESVVLVENDTVE